MEPKSGVVTNDIQFRCRGWQSGAARSSEPRNDLMRNFIRTYLTRHCAPREPPSKNSTCSQTEFSVPNDSHGPVVLEPDF